MQANPVRIIETRHLTTVKSKPAVRKLQDSVLWGGGGRNSKTQESWLVRTKEKKENSFSNLVIRGQSRWTVKTSCLKQQHRPVAQQQSKKNAQRRGPWLFREEASFRPDPGSKLEIKALSLQTVILLRGLRGKVEETHIMKTLLGNYTTMYKHIYL